MTSLPIIWALIMSRALDPYHRIRATVGAIFILAVLMMVLMTMHGPGRRAMASPAGGAGVQSVTSVPAVSAARRTGP